MRAAMSSDRCGWTAVQGRFASQPNRTHSPIVFAEFGGDHIDGSRLDHMPRPFAILLAEPTVVGSIGMLLDKLLPQQLQSDIFVGLQLVMDLCEVGLWFRL